MGLTAFNRMRREAAAAAQNIAPPVVGDHDEYVKVLKERFDPGKKESQINRMNKIELTKYAEALGVSLLGDKTKQQMIAEIQAQEAALEAKND